MARIRSCAIVAEAIAPDQVEIRVIEAATLVGRFRYTAKEVSQLAEHLRLVVAQSMVGKSVGSECLPRSALPK